MVQSQHTLLWLLLKHRYHRLRRWASNGPMVCACSRVFKEIDFRHCGGSTVCAVVTTPMCLIYLYPVLCSAVLSLQSALYSSGPLRAILQRSASIACRPVCSSTVACAHSPRHALKTSMLPSPGGSLYRVAAAPTRNCVLHWRSSSTSSASGEVISVVALGQ